MAMKGYSALPKTPESLKRHHQIVESHIQDTHREGVLTTLQRCSRCILQPHYRQGNIRFENLWMPTSVQHQVRIQLSRAVIIKETYELFRHCTTFFCYLHNKTNKTQFFIKSFFAIYLVLTSGLETIKYWNKWRLHAHIRIGLSWNYSSGLCWKIRR